MTPVLLGTGVIVAMLDRSEQHHRACVEAVDTVGGPLTTCEAVIAESCYLLRRIPSWRMSESAYSQIPLALPPAAAAIQ